MMIAAALAIAAGRHVHSEAARNLLDTAEHTTRQMAIGGAGVTVLGGLAVSEWMMLFGAVLGVATFLLNWRYQHLNYKLKQESLASKPNQ